MSAKSWGRGWPHCQKHKGTDRKHLARGLCSVCYMEETREGTLHDWPTTPSVAAAPHAPEQEAPVAQKWHYNHAACKGCGTTTRPHHSDGYCTQCVMERQGLTPAQATHKIAQGLEVLDAPLSPPQQERLGVVMERKHGGTVNPAAGLARLDAEYRNVVAKAEPARGGLVNPAADIPTWVPRDTPPLAVPSDVLMAESTPGQSVPLGEYIVPEELTMEGVPQPGEQIGGFVDAAGEPVPTEPVACLEVVPGVEHQVRLRATMPDDSPRSFTMGIYGPNPGDDLRPARPTAIDRIVALADFTTEELLAETNGRVAVMQRQWQDHLDIAARYARIAQIIGGK